MFPSKLEYFRTLEDVCVIPPSLKYVKEALSMATSWINKSKPFLSHCSSAPSPSDSLLNFELLKVILFSRCCIIFTNNQRVFGDRMLFLQELVFQSKLMKISLGERSILQTILDDCIQWELDACSLLNGTECLLNINDISNGNSTDLVSKIEHQVASLECVTNSGLCLHFDFVVTLKLKDACSTLQWCLKALSFCDVVPAIEVIIYVVCFYDIDRIVCLCVPYVSFTVVKRSAGLPVIITLIKPLFQNLLLMF